MELLPLRNFKTVWESPKHWANKRRPISKQVGEVGHISPLMPFPACGNSGMPMELKTRASLSRAKGLIPISGSPAFEAWSERWTPNTYSFGNQRGHALTGYECSISMPCHMDFSLRQLATWRLASFRDSPGERRKEHAKWQGHFLWNLILKVTSHCFCHILVFRKESLGSAHSQVSQEGSEEAISAAANHTHA